MVSGRSICKFKYDKGWTEQIPLHLSPPSLTSQPQYVKLAKYNGLEEGYWEEDHTLQWAFLSLCYPPPSKQLDWAGGLEEDGHQTKDTLGCAASFKKKTPSSSGDWVEGNSRSFDMIHAAVHSQGGLQSTRQVRRCIHFCLSVALGGWRWSEVPLAQLHESVF